MASAVDICNLGLSHIGHKATVSSISPPDASVEAQLCTKFYPIARNQMLELHNWGFTTARVALAELTDAAPDSWEYAYQVPNNTFKILAVLDEEATDDLPTAAFIREGDKIFTNVENATLRYERYETDTTKYSALLTNAIALQLGSYLAGYIIKGRDGRAVAKDLRAEAAATLGAAASNDANSERTNTYKDHEGSSVVARR